ncbi:MAG: single-stranded DNA-binding protein [Actinomycetota bacterium]|nr:single-stranded DNA-binding protein [Actinomycetota bacterium]
MTGRLTGDPARKETGKGVLTTFRIGSDDSRRVWVDVETWGHLAGTCAAHLERGRHVAVVGSLAYREWTDQAGERRQRWLVKASTVTFLDRRNHAGAGRGSTSGTPARPAPQVDAVDSTGAAGDGHFAASGVGTSGAAREDGRR